MVQEIFTEVKKGLLLDREVPQTPHGYTIGGFHEVVISVRDLDISKRFYQDISGWEEVITQDLSRDQLDFWQLSDTSGGQECLLTCRGAGSGHVRLVSYSGVEQRPIRANSQSWDTGGIYDIDVRAVDLMASHHTLVKAGWSGFNDPVTYEVDEFHLQEVLMKGPDDVVLAIIKRHRPHLEGYEHMKLLSQVYNTAQIVKDMEVAKEFYIDVLGYKIFREMVLTDAPGGENLFGMPKNLFDKIDCKICMLNPKDENIGTIELVEMKGAIGRDHSAFANPPNLGILMLRIPVDDIETMHAHLQKNKIAINRNIKVLQIPPYGRCKCIAVQSPDGVWLEFVQAIDN